ncbi:MAG: thiamine diphosphokinase [Rhodobacteraceae bacterium]|nr:thiamine diphosphokinase [Paracoccaceae bacterium]
MKNFTRIVESVQNLTLLGGGASNVKEILLALELAPRLFCADGGGNRALAWGLVPEKVIGDLDSADLAELAAAGVETCFVDDQNSTDFEKCIAMLRAPVIIAVGFMGQRLDHQLAALNALAKFPQQPVVLVDAVDICFLCPPEFRLHLPLGTRFSVFPLVAGRCKSAGLEWPLDGLDLSPMGQIGISNRVVSDTLSIDVLSGRHICILPKQYLNRVLVALSFID